ncbi:hypothetical protein F4813DRAFT_231625 [Daldinia decipiens]|uniref:uncharacterized protein n=1 Tax=Daldinia decipiens TaxID=326647 RepID=UPI0020C4D949|nr:uncharacterized protein F4813DRAFT_231625 [Daldinia decipiens]KAI1661509.1 hypothetical protein F4813DRAFT_231625 [Daldinia decipiens]
MAPPISNTSAEPTLYDILSLTPKHLEGQAGISQQQKIVKQAYHRALLKHHPDKSAGGNTPQGSRTSTPTPSTSTSTSTSKPGPKQPSQPRIAYTVDQIQHAYAVLSDRKQRTDYDRALRTAPSQRHSHQSTSSSSFQTGVETVDLDDLAFDERTGLYYRACRCGNARGYAFTEDNLEEFEDDGVLMVECLDCSLWIRVLFAAADDDGNNNNNDDDNRDNHVVATTTTTTTAGPARSASATVREAAVTLTMGSGADAVTSAGERRGSGTGRNFTFNWSVNWGISLSGSATAGTSTSGSRR